MEHLLTAASALRRKLIGSAIKVDFMISVWKKNNWDVSHPVPCIDLIFRNNPNIISKHVVDNLIFYKFHHNIIYDSVDIRVSLHSRGMGL